MPPYAGSKLRPMSDPFFFGYGSLVNRATHAYPRATKARVSGWGRAWRGTRLRRVAYLTAVEMPGAEIDGLIAAVPGADWAALDARERAYARHQVANISHDHEDSVAVQIYKVEPHHEADGEDHPILLSYLDTVVQGYLREFGTDGAAQFFQTTIGWELSILNDRATPIYPRAQPLEADERRFVDDQLESLSTVVKQL